MKLATKILMQKILEATVKIQNELPELYQLLHETPLMSTSPAVEISDEDCKQYLETLLLELNFFTNVYNINIYTHFSDIFLDKYNIY
jgi:hypothetical protein